MAQDNNQGAANLQTDKIIELLQLSGQEKVIILGAGSGQLTIPIAHATKDRVTALEAEQDLLDTLALRAEEEDLANIDRMPSAAGKLNFPDHSFQRAVAAFVLQTAEDPDLVMKEIGRVIIENGIVLILGWKDNGTDNSLSQEYVENKFQALGFDSESGSLTDDVYYVKASKQ